MRHLAQVIWFVALGVATALPAAAAAPKITKVLPQFLDLQGQTTLSPSLYERDAYQAQLRIHPEQRSGLRFAVQWRSSAVGPFKLRVEMRGTRRGQPTTATVEETVRHRGLFGSWAKPALTGEPYRQFGELIAWHATLWDGDKLLSEQRSFLW
jgi:hypothetical protein